ncbi:MAG: DUF4162 domain-containing protein, partial [Melioribacteraceae bacterium]|nr:DUF4162 domain-containing protein [Melioribacteraceae bacterium]
SNAVLVMEILEKADFVHDTSIFGNNLHITVTKDYSDFNEIKIFLRQREIQVNRVEKIIPTLEDVFINLLDIKPNV